MSDTCNVVLVGVGGQGILGMAQLLGRAATDSGLGVRVGQIYGLSQRGGSVEATVRIGEASTAFISPGEADVILGLEPLETERTLERMSHRTVVMVNGTPIVPTTLTQNRAGYPSLESITSQISAVAGVVHVIDADSAARQAGDPRLLNVVMLGAADGLGALPIASEVLASVVEIEGPGRSSEMRLGAFEAGRETGRALADAFTTRGG